jgi:iron complex transport system ATP-binding protein
MRIVGRERWDIFQLRTHLGIVSPDLLASCTTDSTGRDVVLSGFFSSTRIFPHHQPDGDHLQRANASLARLGIGHLADRPLMQMSSGEAKRTLIARALVLQDGQVLMDGRKQDVLTEDNLRKLFQIEVRIHRHEGAFHIY